MTRKTASRPSATRTDRRRAALQRRRQATAARTAAARRVARRRRRFQVLGGVVALAAVAGGTVAVAAVVSRPAKPPSAALHAALVEGAAGPLEVRTVPAAYHAVYRAENYSGAKLTLTTEDASVQRPFNGRVTIREGTSPGGAIQFDGRSTLGSFGNYTPAGVGQVSGDAPSVAFGDVRVGSSLGDLVAQGLFVLRERRHALGRDCQVYRTGTPLQSLKVTAPTDTDYADTCLDASGLVLEEVTVRAGKVTQHLTATELTADPGFEPGMFTVDGDPVPFEQGGSTLTPVDAAVTPVPGFWQLDVPPAGFDHTGRYVLKAADQADPANNPPTSSYVDAYVRGSDIVVVRQGPATAEPDVSTAATASTAAPLPAGALGAAQVLLSSIGPTLVTHPDADTFVHVGGTLSPAELQAVAAALHRV